MEIKQLTNKYKQLEEEWCTVQNDIARNSNCRVSRDGKLVFIIVANIVILFSLSILLWLVCTHLYVSETKCSLVKEDEQLNVSALHSDASQSDSQTVVSCYYNFPDPNNTKQLLPGDLHPHLCTHINVAFASVVNKEIKLEAHHYETLRELVKLKLQNPKLKILLSVGGAHGDTGFPNMVVDHASRKIFIRSIKYILRNHSLDGIDLDWEFPGLSGAHRGRERQHFSQLLREIRMEYIREKRGYILTVAAAAPEAIADVSYDVDQMNRYVDFVNVMTYDFHYYSKYTPFTGLNSPLFPRAGEGLFPATLNVNYTVHMYRGRGLDARRLVVGIPTYGHSFALVTAANAQVGAPARGVGALGSLGFADYAVACAFVRAGASARRDAAARVPYALRGDQWLSYDDPRSVRAKAQYARGAGLRGAMIYSLNADDYGGGCAGGVGGAFPLVRAASEVLLGAVPAWSGTRT